MIKLNPKLPLYHYTNFDSAARILVSGGIKPSVPNTYLSINLKGEFDEYAPTGPEGAGWISGRSNTPNIFLTNTPPELILSEDFGSNNEKNCVFIITIEDILSQNLVVFQNPSKEYPNIYNVPCQNQNTKLLINKDKIYYLEDVRMIEISKKY